MSLLQLWRLNVKKVILFLWFSSALFLWFDKHLKHLKFHLKIEQISTTKKNEHLKTKKNTLLCFSDIHCSILFKFCVNFSFFFCWLSLYCHISFFAVEIVWTWGAIKPYKHKIILKKMWFLSLAQHFWSVFRRDE